MEQKFEEPHLNQGFDRGVDYLTIKDKLITEWKFQDLLLNDTIGNQRDYIRNINRLMYLTIAIIQLSNGSRISEACEAFNLFLKNGTDQKVIVKIAKSKALKTNKEGNKFETKTRYRNIKFPKQWITISPANKNLFSEHIVNLPNLKKCILNYLLRKFECNTHSLRYAFINYMLYTQKKEMSLVAKFVGHSNTNQLVTYTQNKESDKIFDIMDE